MGMESQCSRQCHAIPTGKQTTQNETASRIFELQPRTEIRLSLLNKIEIFRTARVAICIPLYQRNIKARGIA